MPDYSIETGIVLRKQDICGSCFYYPAQCAVFTDLRMEGRAAPYDDVTIVLPADVNGREGYVGCQGYQKHVAPKDKEDRDKNFGLRVPVQLWNLEHGNLMDEPQRLRQG